MIYTLFPKNEFQLPQDFATYEEAVELGEAWCPDGYEIECTTGEVV